MWIQSELKKMTGEMTQMSMQVDKNVSEIAMFDILSTLNCQESKDIIKINSTVKRHIICASLGS